MQNLTIIEMHNLALEAAVEAETEFMNEFGEPAYCGFAWVRFMIDGRSPMAKELVKKGIAKKAWNKGYSIWNVTGNHTQSMDVKECGASAYAHVMQSFGIPAYMESRAD